MGEGVVVVFNPSAYRFKVHRVECQHLKRGLVHQGLAIPGHTKGSVCKTCKPSREEIIEAAKTVKWREELPCEMMNHRFNVGLRWGEKVIGEEGMYGGRRVRRGSWAEFE